MCSSAMQVSPQIADSSLPMDMLQFDTYQIVSMNQSSELR